MSAPNWKWEALVPGDWFELPAADAQRAFAAIGNGLTPGPDQPFHCAQLVAPVEVLRARALGLEGFDALLIVEFELRIGVSGCQVAFLNRLDTQHCHSLMLDFQPDRLEAWFREIGPQPHDPAAVCTYLRLYLNQLVTPGSQRMVTIESMVQFRSLVTRATWSQRHAEGWQLAQDFVPRFTLRSGVCRMNATCLSGHELWNGEFCVAAFKVQLNYATPLARVRLRAAPSLRPTLRLHQHRQVSLWTGEED